MRLITILIKDDSVDNDIASALAEISVKRSINITSSFGEISIHDDHISTSENYSQEELSKISSLKWFMANMNLSELRGCSIGQVALNAILFLKNNTTCSDEKLTRNLNNIVSITKKDKGAYAILVKYNLLELPSTINTILKLGIIFKLDVI